MEATGHGLSSDSFLHELSADDREALCDWSFELYGGLGATLECDGEDTLTFDEDLTYICEEQLSTPSDECRLMTVAEFADCQWAYYENRCDPESIDDQICRAWEACVASQSL